jgi:hypothetical protein
MINANLFSRIIRKLKKTLIPVTRIIIFQPGKVGSMTVQASLERAFENRSRNVEIHHVHALNQLDKREEFVKKTRKNPTESLALIQQWKKLRVEIANHPRRRWYIINLVRDPIAMKVSALFQLLDQHIPDWQERHAAGILKMTDLINLFFTKREFDFSGLETWYDIQVREIWNIDVFSKPFPKEKGYVIYSQANIRLMIIRLEDLNRVANQAFYDFLGLQGFQVVDANVGEKKPYAKLYAEFKSLPLPSDYVDRGYRTRFANHFYTTEEIERFRRRWKHE